MMRPTSIKGDNAVAYYDALVTDPQLAQKPSRVEDYYLSTDEPPGVVSMRLGWRCCWCAIGLLGRLTRSCTRTPCWRAKVKSADGRWRSIDASMLYRDQRVLGALYQAALRAEVTTRLGVAWGPVVKGQTEIAGVPAGLLEAFSRRAAQVHEAVAVKAERFRSAHDREPSRREWGIIARDAAKESRPRKQLGRSADRLRSEWLMTASEHCQDPAALAEVVGAVGERARADGERFWVRGAGGRMLRAEERARERLADGVLAALAVQASAWTRAEVEREVAARLPAVHGVDALDQVRAVQHAAGEIVALRCVDLAPVGVRGAARAALEDSGLQRYSTRELVEQEQQIGRWFSEAAAAGGEPIVLGAKLAVGLDPEQAQAAGLVAGHGGLVVVVGPAGAGKTRAMSAAVAALRQQGRPVLGLAPSARAAEQLEREAGLRSETVARFLTEQEFSDGPSGELELPGGGTLVVDEAGMLRTDDVERLMRVVRRRGYRLALVGDSRQLAAVGRGGMFDEARSIAPLVQLRDVRRFAEPWEAEASLLLRECEPTAFDLYERQGRVRAGTAEQMRQAMLEDWWRARQAGGRPALTVSSNEQGRALNMLARARLIDAGTVGDTAAVETVGGERVGVGDEIQTRQNDRSLQTESGEKPPALAHRTGRSGRQCCRTWPRWSRNPPRRLRPRARRVGLLPDRPLKSGPHAPPRRHARRRTFRLALAVCRDDARS